MFCASARHFHFRQASAPVDPTLDVATAVRRVLDVPGDQLDYARAKIAFDGLIDPAVDEDAVLGELDRMAATARALSGPGANDAAKLSALRTVVYAAGPWNGDRPFAYDHSDPYGRAIRGKLLHNYLATRLGQCVSMPILFLILAERLGLNVALASAPEHAFVRYTDASGRTVNIETTSGGHAAREQWFSQNFPITDRSIETGLYLGSLSKREGVALMATTVMEHAFEQRRWEDVVALCKVILAHRPKDAQTMVCMGSAYGQLLDRLRRQHPNPWATSPVVRAQMHALIAKNISLISAAERLGWVPFE